MNYTKHSVPSITSSGFTLIELIVAISLVMILLVFSIAPYSYYSDKSRVRLSSDRVEQMMTKAKLLAGTGYAPQGKNVDLVVHIATGSREIILSAIPANTPPPPLNSVDRKVVEIILLESSVAVTQIGSGSTLAGIDIVYRSPTGLSQIWETPSATATPTLYSGTPVTGGILGIK